MQAPIEPRRRLTAGVIFGSSAREPLCTPALRFRRGAQPTDWTRAAISGPLPHRGSLPDRPAG